MSLLGGKMHGIFAAASEFSHIAPSSNESRHTTVVLTDEEDEADGSRCWSGLLWLSRPAHKVRASQRHAPGNHFSPWHRGISNVGPGLRAPCKDHHRPVEATLTKGYGPVSQ
ncbi:hypothetical protein JDV02_001603 [Purpureocillium takamizusanense]|uniref:Uncharacterized protein n=1 Tax=Purpureocillium takamizusanense TaxID=2060973 RepID=A0A9Q8Q8J2_9HYPO|nr:uncharacterized protein JDV02_001603 [Purpureocillium takamizusanense]UNI15030.1 hypothetical protein JDV02_001603 [Purpureocillium takamizusanense]